MSVHTITNMGNQLAASTILGGILELLVGSWCLQVRIGVAPIANQAKECRHVPWQQLVLGVHDVAWLPLNLSAARPFSVSFKRRHIGRHESPSKGNKLDPRPS